MARGLGEEGERGIFRNREMLERSEGKKSGKRRGEWDFAASPCPPGALALIPPTQQRTVLILLTINGLGEGGRDNFSRTTTVQPSSRNGLFVVQPFGNLMSPSSLPTSFSLVSQMLLYNIKLNLSQVERERELPTTTTGTQEETELVLRDDNDWSES